MSKSAASARFELTSTPRQREMFAYLHQLAILVDPAGYAPASEHCRCSILAIKLRAQLYYSTVKLIWRPRSESDAVPRRQKTMYYRYTTGPHLKLITEQSTSQQITNSRQPYQLNTGHSCIPAAR